MHTDRMHIKLWLLLGKSQILLFFFFYKKVVEDSQGPASAAASETSCKN